MPSPSSSLDLLPDVTKLFERTLGLDPGEVTPDMSIGDLGFESIRVLQLCFDLGRISGRTGLNPMQLANLALDKRPDGASVDRKSLGKIAEYVKALTVADLAEVLAHEAAQ